MPETTCDKCEAGVSFSKALICMKHDYATPASYNIPWWGQSRSQHIKNAGFVIGFKKQNGEGWRLDYDDQKKIHINWISANGQNRVAHKLKTDAQPFDVTGVTSLVVPPDVKHKEYKDDPEAWIRALWWTWAKGMIAAGKLPDNDAQGQIAAKYQDKQAWNTWEKIQTVLTGAKAYKDVKGFFA